MVLTRKELHTEVHEGSGASCVFYANDNRAQLNQLLQSYTGKVRMIYMDPPYMTGDRFHMRVRAGEAAWLSGRASLVLDTFSDQMDRNSYLAMMKDVLQKCRALLSDDGMVFLHADYRIQPYLRLLMDEVFGEENFLNEIIWAYQSGGRATRHFSRKHDVILFYSKTANYDFNLQDVMIKPDTPKTNHMRRHVDPDGRVYRSIRVGGKTYTYYDDDPVAPSDVWTDVSHLQQRDPERTGYDTQKPLALLERIVRCSTRPGDLVLDPFCGSGTTLEAAARLGRDCIGIDQCGLTANILRRRLNKLPFTLEFPVDPADAEPLCEAHVLQGVGFYHVTLERFEAAVEGRKNTPEGTDIIDSWTVGFIRDGRYIVQDEYIRSKKTAALKPTLDIPAYTGQMAMCVNDVFGRSFLYEIDPE